MADARYDYYTDGENAGNGFSSVRWIAETFTVGETFVIKSVKLKLLRDAVLAPGTITVSIKNTAANEPIGDDLIYGTTNGNTLTDDAAGEWRTITFNTQKEISAGTTLSIVVRSSGAGAYPAKWRTNNDSDYSGRYCYSDDSGDSWTVYHDTPNATDFMFECWGEADFVLASAEKVTVRRLVVFASDKVCYET